MIKWFKRNADLLGEETRPNDTLSTEIVDMDAPDLMVKQGLFARIKQSLSKTRHQLGDGLARLLLGKKEISPELLQELETLLIGADLGIDATQRILQQLSEQVDRSQLKDGEALYFALSTQLQAMLEKTSSPLDLQIENHKPFVILMIGVNGAGKTTTIGKLAKQYQQQGKKVMLAAGDTFRAAAVEQLQAWGARHQIPVIAQHTGADSASVIFDAFTAAKARQVDILIADTAGRLHTQNNLMDELKKIKRVIQKIDSDAPHEVMLVLDASIGQNALSQAREFSQAIGVTGITMTKLDGTAKGGIVFAIAHELALPFRYLGMGEGADDLRPFDAAQFVRAIIDDDRI
jgi:fused signal recognition particle receptor